MQGLTFSATFSAVAVTAAQDVFEITTAATSRIEITEINLGQYSDFGDAQAELLSIQLISGHSVAGSGGSVVTPSRFAPWSRAATATVKANNTTVATVGTPLILVSDSFNVAAGFQHRPNPKTQASSSERIFVNVSSIFVVRITAPADSLTLNGTIKWKEIGLQG